MAMLFLVEERQLHKPKRPLLSCADVLELLGFALPKRNVTEEEMQRQMNKRHRKRHASIEHHYRKQRMKDQLPGQGGKTRKRSVF